MRLSRVRLQLARRVPMLLCILLIVACTSPAAVAPPTPVAPTSLPPVAMSATAPTETIPPAVTTAPTGTASPTATAEPATSASPTMSSTVTSAATAPPATTESAATAEPDDLAGCGEAHPATYEESTDLQAAGRDLAPPLSDFNQYRFDLVLDRDAAIITGTQTLEFTNRTGGPLPDLMFHLYPNLPDFGGWLDVTCAAVDDNIVEPVFEDDDWLMRLPLPAPLAPGASARVTLRFYTLVPRGEAETNYGAFGAGDDFWAMASFYPILAIRVGDAWDTLRPNGWGDFVTSDVALYHARISLPADHQIIATGEESSACEAERCTAAVEAGPRRDFTMALAEGWDQARRSVGDVAVVSWFPPEERAAGERALELSADALARFSDAFGPYPFTELDIMPIPAKGFAGVEYPGLIMIGDDYYTEPQDPRLDLQDVVVHEVAHMWWYDVVGNDVLREPWLDEGLTSYSGEYLYTEWSGQGAKPLTDARRAQIERLGLDDEPIDQAVAEYDEPGAYVGVVYGRAPLFFDALRRELGDETFFELLQDYYRRNAFGRATTAGFEALAEEVAGRQLDPFLREWLSPELE